ncbi:hypothetical protein ABBQ32_009456 [Trebouxia sp. C0010 RCD-2024]
MVDSPEGTCSTPPSSLQSPLLVLEQLPQQVLVLQQAPAQERHLAHSMVPRLPAQQGQGQVPPQQGQAQAVLPALDLGQGPAGEGFLGPHQQGPRILLGRKHTGVMTLVGALRALLLEVGVPRLAIPLGIAEREIAELGMPQVRSPQEEMSQVGVPQLGVPEAGIPLGGTPQLGMPELFPWVFVSEAVRRETQGGLQFLLGLEVALPRVPARGSLLRSCQFGG